MKISYLLLLPMLLSCEVAAKSQVEDKPVSDGPYVSYLDDKKYEATWVCDDKVISEIVNIETKQAISSCQLPAQLNSQPLLPQWVEYNDGKNIVALSDMHGQYELSKKLLRNNGVIDNEDNWALGNAHLVITGDVFDRGDKVTEILWMLYKLERQAESVGGKLHLLLGNHEVMILNGDLRYLHPKYIKVAKLLKTRFNELFEETSVLGRWLRSKSVLVKIDGYLFAHGGFHPDLAKGQFTLADINHLFKANLVESEQAQPRKGWGRYLYKSDGPIWYRGYFKDDGATQAEIDFLLAHFEVKKIVVGHTSQQRVLTKHQGKVVAIDASLKRGRYGEVLFIEQNPTGQDKLFRGTLEGKKIPLD